MKRTVLYLFALLAMFAVAACGGGDGPDTPSGSGGGGGGGEQPSSYPQTYSQSVTIPATAGEQVVTLYDLSTAVSSVGSTPRWIVVSPQYYTSGTPTLKLEFEANTNTEKRECTVTVTASNSDKVLLQVTQAAAEVKKGIDDVHDEQTDQPAYAPAI